MKLRFTKLLLGLLTILVMILFVLSKCWWPDEVRINESNVDDIRRAQISSTYPDGAAWIRTLPVLRVRSVVNKNNALISGLILRITGGSVWCPSLLYRCFDNYELIYILLDAETSQEKISALGLKKDSKINEDEYLYLRRKINESPPTWAEIREFNWPSIKSMDYLGKNGSSDGHDLEYNLYKVSQSEKYQLLVAYRRMNY